MIPFLLIFFAIYGIYHLYFFRKIQNGFHLSWGPKLLLFLILFLLTAAPVLVRVLEHAEFLKSAYTTALVGYIWMGFVFEFFCWGLLLEILLLAVRIWQYTSKRKIQLVSPRNFFITISILSLATCLYGGYEAANIVQHDITITTHKLPKDIQSIKIAQISDVHLGLLTGTKKLTNIIQKIEEIDPDLLVCTGDLLDGQGDGIAQLAALLSDVSPKLGKYAILGNHEFYTGIDKSKKFINDAGFTILDGRAVSPEGVITLAGVDDRVGRYAPSRPEDEVQMLRQTRRDLFVLFLKHRPIINQESIGLFDLQLSGHTHQGQLFPFNFVTQLKFPVPNGKLVELTKGHLYVSRGTGTWGPPIRVLAPPEIPVFTLVAAE